MVLKNRHGKLKNRQIWCEKETAILVGNPLARSHQGANNQVSSDSVRIV